MFVFDAAYVALHELAFCDVWKDTHVAVASRSNRPAWATQLLPNVILEEGDGSKATKRLSDIISCTEIYPGSKIKHFGRIKQQTGAAYPDMVFVDDWIKNHDEVSKLGVTCFLCTGGLKAGDFAATVGAWARAKADGTLQGRTLFRPPGAFTRSTASTSSTDATDATASVAPVETVRELPCFSMSQPFASLLACGLKTVETRRSGTFAALSAGTWAALHVGRRDWPDPAQTHLDVLRERGLTDAEAAAACSLPEPYQVMPCVEGSLRTPGIALI